MLVALREQLEADERIAYALLYGSVARGEDRQDSDVDVAIGLSRGASLSHRDIGELVSRLEAAVERDVDLLVLDDAPVALAYRVFRDGAVLFERDHDALVGRKARAILEYLDFRHIEERCADGVLAAASHGR